MGETRQNLIDSIIDAPASVVDLSVAVVQEHRAYPLPRTRERAVRVAQGHMRFMPASNLRLMLAVADDEFHIHYQPSIDCKTGEIAHLEALLRWPAGQGTHSTEEIVRSLELNSLIGEVGRNILNRACMDLAELRRNGHPGLTLSMNVSAGQLADANLVMTIDQTLKRYRIPPRQFQVEITETMLAEGDSIPLFVEKLNAIGVATLVDDFGLGYNNLGVLRSVPVAGLKLDRSFVAGLGRNRRDSVIAKTIIGLAKSLHMITVAEGVETDVQARWLRRHDVTRMQGWAYSKALPISGIRNLLLQQPWAKKAFLRR